MKKIIFALLFITIAFSQFDNTIAGWYNEHYYVPEGSVYSEGIVVADESSLGSESLAETDFTTHANWDVTNDFDDSGGNAAYTWSANQTSTLTQIQANLATAGVGDRWYVFTYTVAVTTAFDGDGAVTITTGFASSAVSLSLVAGTHTVYFKSKTTPVDFVISVVSGSDTEGTWTIDDVTLKEIQGGNVEAYGLFTGGGSTGLKIDSDGVARLPKAIFLDEKASQETIVAGEGQYWVKDDTPTNPMFTDDTGDDHVLRFGSNDYAEMYFNANGNATVIETANTPIAIRQLTTGTLSGWTFDVGSTSNITAYADYSGTVAGTVLATTTSTASLVTGDVVSIRGTTNYNGIFSVTVVDATHFYFTDTWVADDGASDWDQGSHLIAGSGAGGIYVVDWDISASEGGGAGSTFTYCLYINVTPQDKTIIQRKFANNDVGAFGGHGLITISASDVVFMMAQSTGTNDVTHSYGNIVLTKL